MKGEGKCASFTYDWLTVPSVRDLELPRGNTTLSNPFCRTIRQHVPEFKTSTDILDDNVYPDEDITEATIS